MKLKQYCWMLFLLAEAFVPALPASAEQPFDLGKLKAKVDPYVSRTEKTPDWLYARLQMYWSTHATDVFINGESFDHPGGDRAPVPTVKFNGMRGTASSFDAPKIEDLVPYDDDEAGNVTYISHFSHRMEKAHPAKTGCNIGSVNRRILGIAADAAAIYAATGEERYARLALGVFDTYLKGIYYRNVPTDLNRGHMQTLVGMQTFEVIHEDVIVELTEIYQRLGRFITRDRDLYEAALKKWAENIIANGVPHNNWNLFQAEFIARIAMVLQPDSHYADGRGRAYYLARITDASTVRQWSMRRLAEFGFDPSTGIWYESPGYSTGVVNDFADFANTLDRDAGIDLFRQLPVLQRAVMATPQYLFPNRMIAGFGDTHPSYLSDRAVRSVLSYAGRHGARQLTDTFTRLQEAIRPDAPDTLVEQYVSPNFYAPNVSWLVQRTGMNPAHDLMVSINGSLGNHQHANGISMELYGKGYVMGPDGGIGKFLYSGDDYHEYYSQFPAHNTVCVDGVSSYPVMMSQHAFTVDDRFPQSNDDRFGLSGDGQSFPPVTYSQVSFIEPESYARQVRVNGIVKTSATGGYYVDIFRSRKVLGGDKTHDYFYHNLGQTMTLSTFDDKPLPLQDTDLFAFAGGHLYAYSYLFDKQAATFAGDVKATFVTNNDLRMTMWMQGSSDRIIARALSPANLEYERMPHQPYDIGTQPVLTYIARQQGDAWNHPFVAVYEPSTNAEPSEIKSVEFFRPVCSDPSAVGIKVVLRNGRTDYIFSNVGGSSMRFGKMRVKGRYAVVSDQFILTENQLRKK